MKILKDVAEKISRERNIPYKQALCLACKAFKRIVDAGMGAVVGVGPVASTGVFTETTGRLTAQPGGVYTDVMRTAIAPGSPVHVVSPTDVGVVPDAPRTQAVPDVGFVTPTGVVVPLGAPGRTQVIQEIQEKPTAYDDMLRREHEQKLVLQGMAMERQKFTMAAPQHYDLKQVEMLQSRIDTQDKKLAEMEKLKDEANGKGGFPWWLMPLGAVTAAII